MKSSLFFIKFSFLLAFSSTVIDTVTSAKILFLLPIASHQQKLVFEPLIKKLALRGHDVTVVSPVPTHSFPISVKEIHPATVEELGYEITSAGKDLLQTRKDSKSTNRFLPVLWNTSSVDNGCHKLYNDVEIIYLMKGLKRFDLAVVNGLQNECALGLVSHFRVPHIYLTPMAAPNYFTARFGHYFPPSFVPSTYTAFDDQMTFLERCLNFGVETFLVLVAKLYLYPHYEAIYRSYIGAETPGIEEIDDNVGVVLMYSNFIMSHPRPLPPNIIEIGGMHCHFPRPLPTEFDKFLSEPEEGFIYVSLGPLVKAKDMPETLLNIFTKVFSNSDLNVIWKWDGKIPKLPTNVRVGNWLPQQDILGHPNIKLFISNGGLLNIQEAIFHGVPMLGIPFTAEHDLHLEQAENEGFSLRWEILDLNQTKLEELIYEMVIQPRYRARVKSLSKMYKDTPDDALEKAIFWTEYVIRNKGAPQLRSPSKDLNYFQYHCFDVILFLSALLLLTCYLFCKVISMIFLKKRVSGQASVERKNGTCISSITNKQN